MIHNPEPAIVTGEILATAGAPQIAVTRCPHCAQAHRHLSDGLRTPACGGRPYIIRLDLGRTQLRAA